MPNLGGGIVPMKPLHEIMKLWRNGSKFLHILKVDIEDSEWDVLKQLTSSKILDYVGQIAVEIHLMELLKLPAPAILPYLRQRHSILRLLESRGFARVAYWENEQDEFSFFDRSGMRYETAGEVLYVNTNWYNASFKANLPDIGEALNDM
ncbi:putative methyltransferase-like protein 24 [Oratosquilla oratoria]|uniref:putative methyltransferase-like protein 24 n=1 Tax=Oratosquilla oratoria TaxID=337810 RepID=UPI003F76B5CC